MKAIDFIVQLSDPRKVIACYTIFLVVRAVENDDTHEDYLFSDLCPEHDCVVADGSTMNVYTDFEFTEDKPLVWIDDGYLKDINTSYLEVLTKDSPHTEKSNPKRQQWWGNVFVPSPLPESKCEQQVEQYLRDLHNFELWAIQMWDATAKPAAGLLSGNSNQLGDFDSCLAVQLAALGTVESKYCLADVDLEGSPDALPSVRAAVLRLQAGAFVRSKHSDPGHFAPRWSTLHWGLCVPASCSDLEVEDGLRTFLQPFELPGVTVDLAVKPGMCYTLHRDTSLPFLTLVTLGFFGGILMLAVVSTMVDVGTTHPKDGGKQRIRDCALMAFSLRRSWALLASSQSDELPVIHGVRSVFTLMLFVAHKLMPLALTPYSNRGFLTQCSHSALSSVLRASSVFTDSFLHLSAVLAAYNMARELQVHGSISWMQRVLARFIRLTPALFAVVIFYAYVMEHLGTGPQWYSTVTANANLCKASLWKNILYIQNFFFFEDMCAPHTHQLALDMQLFLTAPAVVYALHHWPSCTLSALGLLQLAVAALRYFTHLHLHLSDFIYHNISVTDLYRTANLSYSQPEYRAIPYISGILTGFFIQRVKKIHMSQSLQASGWLTCAGLALIAVFYPSHLAQPDAVFDHIQGAWYSAFSPIAWSLALSWLITACTFGYGGWLHCALCHHWLVVLSRLSYTIYLTQFIIFYYYVGSIRSSQEFSLFYTIGVYEVIGVLLTSLSVTLLFDLPMQEIKNIVLPRRKVKKSS